MIGQQLPLQPQGDLVPASALTAYLTNFSHNVSPEDPELSFSTVTNSTTVAVAMTPTNCAEGLINAKVVWTGGTTPTNTTDTATNIINQFWPGHYVGATAELCLVNLNSGTSTVAGGTGVTISGTATIPTLAAAWYRAKITNLADPTQAGSVTTNTTTTTAAVAVNSTQANPTSVIPVAASTGMVNLSSWLVVTNADGTSSNYFITAINTLNITVAGTINKAIANGAAVAVHNDAITFLRMYSTVTATMAA